MAKLRTDLRMELPGRRRVAMGSWLMVPAFVVAGGLGGFVLARWPDLSPTRLAPQAVNEASMVAVSVQQFPICAGSKRVTCVVDGDTFWLQGTKIRIADIDTPEISKPGCDQEAALGRQATLRMGDLLSAGPFELAPADRDEDVYGRKLRIVMRDGASIGDILVAEGLAHQWRGHQEEWC